MRSPADMAAMLPYLLGFFPDDSVVAVGLQGPSFRQGGVIRLDIPEDPRDWPFIAEESARLLLELSTARDRRPAAVLLYLCRDSSPGAAAVTGWLRPLADHLVQAFRALDLPVKEALCLSDGRWWSYLCADPACCDPRGTPVHSGLDPGPAVAAATFAGLAPRGSRKAITEALTPIGPPAQEPQRQALERWTAVLLAAIDRPGGLAQLLDDTAQLLAEVMAEFRAGSLQLDDDRAARLILGLQDKLSRDRAAEYAEPDELACAQRLWRCLARRCVPPFEEYAAAPLTLLAWTAWLAGDVATSRVVLAKALDLDPDYTLAQLLYRSLNGGLEPDRLLETVRAARSRRDPPEAASPPIATGPARTPVGREPGAVGSSGAGSPGEAAADRAGPGGPLPGRRIPGQRQGGGPLPPRLPDATTRPPDPGTPPGAATSAAAAPAAPGHRFARPAGWGGRRHPRKIRDSSIGA